jgi:hypothetical protein
MLSKDGILNQINEKAEENFTTEPQIKNHIFIDDVINQFNEKRELSRGKTALQIQNINIKRLPSNEICLRGKIKSLSRYSVDIENYIYPLTIYIKFLSELVPDYIDLTKLNLEDEVEIIGTYKLGDYSDLVIKLNKIQIEFKNIKSIKLISTVEERERKREERSKINEIAKAELERAAWLQKIIIILVILFLLFIYWFFNM